MTTSLIYLIVLPENKFYVGIDSTGKRIVEHHKGECKTTAPHLNGDMPLMIPLVYVAPGDPSRLEAAITLGLRNLGWDIVNRNYPRDFTPEERARGKQARIDTHRRNGTGLFDPAVRALAHTPEATAKAEATRKRDKSGLYNPVAHVNSTATQKRKSIGLFDLDIQSSGRGKGLESQRQNSSGLWDPAVREKGRHTRWHINRNRPKTGCSFCEAKALEVGA